MSLLRHKSAIDIALEAHRRPELLSLMSASPLPRDVKKLLRIAANGAQSELKGKRYGDHSPDAIQEVSTAFLSVILFSKRSDPYRVLGLNPGASGDEVRENKRLLLKWLHPDRNLTGKNGGQNRELLSRVLEAAAEIEGKPQIRAQQVVPPPIRPFSPRVGVSRPPANRAALHSARPSALSGLWRRRSRLRLPRLTTLSLSIQRASYTVGAVLVALIMWRFIMQEPIGRSLERYSQAAIGLVSW